MMGAGKDPLKKDHVFAKLTNEPEELMKTTFLVDKKKINNFNIPIIDVFSRTLACPIATQRQNPMVAARIASNLTLNTQNLDICHEGIRTLLYKSESL
jgi:dynein heavy chain